MRIFFIASEVDPFAKTGGLADVAAALPKALVALGHDVRIIMPLYRQVNRERFALRRTAHRVDGIPGQPAPADVWEATLPKSRVVTYFLDIPVLFDREGLYQIQGKDHPDNLLRFSVFSQAALRLLPKLAWTPLPRLADSPGVRPVTPRRHRTGPVLSVNRRRLDDPQSRVSRALSPRTLAAHEFA